MCTQVSGVSPLNFANPILCKFLPPPPPPTMWADWPLAEDGPASGWDLSLSLSLLARRGIISHLLLRTASRRRRRRRNAVQNDLVKYFQAGGFYIGSSMWLQLLLLPVGQCHFCTVADGRHILQYFNQKVYCNVQKWSVSIFFFPAKLIQTHLYSLADLIRKSRP